VRKNEKSITIWSGINPPKLITINLDFHLPIWAIIWNIFHASHRYELDMPIEFWDEITRIRNGLEKLQIQKGKNVISPFDL